MIPPFLAKPLLCFAAALAIAAVVIFTLNAFEDRGALKEREAISRQNQEAGNAADHARSRYDDCTAHGLRFDFATGQCAGASVHRRD